MSWYHQTSKVGVAPALCIAWASAHWINIGHFGLLDSQWLHYYSIRWTFLWKCISMALVAVVYLPNTHCYKYCKWFDEAPEQRPLLINSDAQHTNPSTVWNHANDPTELHCLQITSWNDRLCDWCYLYTIIFYTVMAKQLYAKCPLCFTNYSNAAKY